MQIRRDGHIARPVLFAGKKRLGCLLDLAAQGLISVQQGL